MTELKPIKKRKANSPYQKYGKVPFRYSELYYAWRRAIKDGKTSEARRLSEQHTERWLGTFIRERDAA